jgi:hypothetical protein
VASRGLRRPTLGITGDSEFGSALAGVQRERHGRKPSASYLSEVPQAYALHRLKERRPQVPVRPFDGVDPMRLSDIQALIKSELHPPKLQ